ncbi:MAG: 4Fe-4S dicluster domain-containing protein [Gammaproteobacteria bacterium]|nr:4Fe-4S dicluster domain-containing protein [Gammaproteobacteria bacterium]
MTALFIPRKKLQELVDILTEHGYQCIGPSVKDGAIVFEPFSCVDALAKGYVDTQDAGRYSLTVSNLPTIFDWTVGPQGIKPWVFKPRENLWQAQKDSNNNLQFSEVKEESRPIAFFGARACDIAALKIQDQHFNEDLHYNSRREKLFIIGVNCSRSAATCFCTSTGDGPEITAGVDISMSELLDGFIIHSTSLRARLTIDELNLDPASYAQLQQAKKNTQNAATQQRSLPRTLHTQLTQRTESKAWDTIAETCLACGNCTAVCPTCFCNNQHDESSLDGKTVSHFREWDSCFNEGHSYIHGVVIRAHTPQRYRQWLTHKLDTWHDQIGRSGCVGCGRCISWCPVGIDITETVKAVVEESE